MSYTQIQHLYMYFCQTSGNNKFTHYTSWLFQQSYSSTYIFGHHIEKTHFTWRKHQATTFVWNNLQKINHILYLKNIVVEKQMLNA